MFNTELTTYKTGGGTPSDKSMHPGEYGRVSAWIKKTKNELVLNKDIYGHPPSTVFERPATQYMRVRTTDPGTGYDTAGANQSYVVAANGTPQLRRHIDFSPPDTTGASTEQAILRGGAHPGDPGAQKAPRALMRHAVRQVPPPVTPPAAAASSQQRVF